MVKLPSHHYDEALEATKKFHTSQKRFSGRFLLRYTPEIKLLIKKYGCKTMLDYGCGKGIQYEQPIDETGVMMEDYLGVKVSKYDPGWSAFAAEPQGKYDIVVCTQVLGSIPVCDLDWVINRIYSFAKKVVFIGEKIAPCRKTLHADIKVPMPHDWNEEKWLAVLREHYFPGVPGYFGTKGNMELI